MSDKAMTEYLEDRPIAVVVDELAPTASSKMPEVAHIIKCDFRPLSMAKKDDGRRGTSTENVESPTHFIPSVKSCGDSTGAPLHEVELPTQAAKVQESVPSKTQSELSLTRNHAIKIPRALHRVDSGRITKNTTDQKRQQRRVPIIANEGNIVDLTTDEVLRILQRSVRQGKLESDASQRQMKRQIEQLVCLNTDYQAQLELAEQDLEAQEEKLQRYRQRYCHRKEELAGMDSTMKSLVDSQAVMAAEIQALRLTEKDREAQWVSFNQSTKESLQKVSKIKSTVRDLQTCLADQQNSMKFLQAELTGANERTQEKKRQLAIERSRVSKLESFIQELMLPLAEKKHLITAELQPLVETLSSVQTSVNDLKDRPEPKLSLEGLNITVPGMNECLELLQAMRESEGRAPADLQDFRGLLGRLEERYVYRAATNVSNDNEVAWQPYPINNYSINPYYRRKITS